MANENSPEEPWALRVLIQRFTEYVSRLGEVWVAGEVSSVRVVGNAAYLTVRDVDGKISADAQLSRQIWQGLPRPAAKGDRVVMLAKLTITSKTQVLLRVRDIRLAGVGDLMAQIEQRRNLLRAEGLFDASRKRRPPLIPRKVGVIAGRDSDALKDVRRIATTRWPQVVLEVRETPVQGQGTVPAVQAALRELDADPLVDVIIVTRGGGSFEDLLPFSDESLVRSVAAATTPVISAIGHEADHPILDEVADARASTPTHAATLAVPDAQELLKGVADSGRRMRFLVEQRVSAGRLWLQQIASRPVLSDPHKVLERPRQLVADDAAALDRAVRKVLLDCQSSLGADALHLRALSPQGTLDRGYALVTDPAGRLVTVPPEAGEQVDVIVKSGRFGARVLEEEVHG